MLTASKPEVSAISRAAESMAVRVIWGGLPMELVYSVYLWRMRILLSDGAGLTSRQCAALLARAGHRVEVLSPDPLCLCRFTKHVKRVHRVPAYGADPFGWLTVARRVVERRRIDLLLPTQEQVAVLALAAERFGVPTVVPEFDAVARVQDKVSAAATLRELGVPQPESVVVGSKDELGEVGGFPVYVKAAIGTASTGVRRVGDRAELLELPEEFATGVLVQQAVEGPLVMVQAVFAAGELVAFHACERVREGVSGGASHKRGRSLPEVREMVAVLGRGLRWHGALSADVILGADGPRLIDVNPRLVEPVNAYLSGVDLVGALLEVAATGQAAIQKAGRPGVETHQLLLGILGAAQRGRGAVLREIASAVLRRRDYRGSAEELTPLDRDPLTVLPVVMAGLATLVRPETWTRFTSGSVEAYALTPDAWAEIRPGSRRPS
jgi:glutathione synthase/RimK-type ligase-like ATP-grasp enzyme